MRLPSPANTRGKLLVLAAIFALGVLFRLLVIRVWRAPAGDGLDYYALSQELLLHGRFAYRPWPAPLSYARMPGYPLFLAYLAVHAAPLSIDEHLFRNAALAGVVLGLGLLTRADTVTLAPAVLLAFHWARGPRGRRLLAMALCALLAAAVFAPWPLRNLVQFNHAHATSWYWRSRLGTPLPMGFIRWARTFGSGHPGDSYVDLRITVGGPLDTSSPAVLLPTMYDSPQEKQRLVALFEQYNDERLSPAVDAGFTALARERERRAPFRTFVLLPLRRLRTLWSPIPDHELPMQVDFLDLPAQRGLFALFDGALYAAALCGAARLWWRGRRCRRGAAIPPDALHGRRLALMMLACILLRSVLLSLIVPIALTQRHAVELFPMLITLAAAL